MKEAFRNLWIKTVELKKHRRQCWAVFLSLAWIFLLLCLSLLYYPTKDYQEEPFVLETAAPSSSLATPSSAVPAETAPTEAAPVLPPQTVPSASNFTRKEIVLKRGDNLSTLFKSQGIPARELVSMTKVPEAKKAALSLKQDQVLTFLFEGNNFVGLEIPLNASEDLLILKKDDIWNVEKKAHTFSTETKTQTMTVENSLYGSAKKQEVPAILITQAISLFEGKFDLNRMVRTGDALTMQYEVNHDTTTGKTSVGRITAVQFVHQKTIYYGFLYRNNQGRYKYYDTQGKSLEKAFMRNPVPGSRISSPFNLKRKHPILRTIRPHLGVDLAAPYGTPIRASGDGRISFIGRKGGYGRAIIINHGGGITTLYGHMSRFVAKEKVGTSVKMGQVIGYIGTSGLSTAPHLHYEYRIGKRYYNPMTVFLPDASSIPASQKQAFTTYVEQEIAALNEVSHVTAV